VTPVGLVTGASRGIGAACAEGLARAGWDVGITYAADRDGAERTADAVEAAGRRAHVCRADAREPGSGAAAVHEVEAALGPLDAAVLNAGVTRDGMAVRMAGEAWSEPIEVNLGGTFEAAQAAGAGMAQRGAGSIVALGSIVGTHGNAGQANYAASKAGVIGLVRALARELGPAGVRVNAVVPGYIRTRLTDAIPEEGRRRMLDATALGRFGEPEDVVGPVVFLCSGASSFVTGAALAVDGGMSI
jgi:3-oxoacyl-[acyl-carrier protein] reductase